MIVSLFYPFNLRGKDAPFLWVYYSQISSFKKEEVTFLIDKSYLHPKTYFEENNRWEIKEGYWSESVELKKNDFNNYVFPQSKLDDIYNAFESDLIFFKTYLTDVIEPLETVFLETLKKMLESHKIDVVLSWSNCPSLQSACDKLGIKTAYNELGPLRPPVFKKTGFYDVKGVNGNTDSETRFNAFKREIHGKDHLLMSCEEILTHFLKQDYLQYAKYSKSNSISEIDLGLILQVENDSNVIAYSNGFNNDKLISISLSEKENQRVVAREHPQGLKKYKEKIEIDISPNSLTFINKCKRLKTVNSGAALEAALLGKEVEILGDSPYKILNNLIPNSIEHLVAINFLALNYLVPFDKVFDKEYIAFRMSNPHELTLYFYHVSLYSKEISNNFSELLLTANEKLANAEKEIRKLEVQKTTLEVDYYGMNTSLSWRMTAPLRKTKEIAFVIISPVKKVYLILKTLYNSPNEIGKVPELLMTKNEIIGFRLSEIKKAKNFIKGYPNIKTAKILTTRHCLFIGELIKNELLTRAISAEIIFEKPLNGYTDDLYFVICPQMFSELPKYYVAYQLEQSVSSRWFNSEYFDKLKNSITVFDYSLRNLEYLQKNGFSLREVFYMPISYLPDYREKYNLTENVDEKHDVLFYGDINIPRRKKFLEKISERFKVKVVSEVFGLDLYKELLSSKIIINIHYYEGALLETTRLYECLSLDRLIISEESVDQDEHNNLSDIVEFVPINNVDLMIDRIEYWLANDDKRKDKIEANKSLLTQISNGFNLGMNRFMLNEGIIDYTQMFEGTQRRMNEFGNFMCLSLPESVERRKQFSSVNKYGIRFFNGLRHKQGWIGCGLSYKYIINKAKEMNLEYIIVCEDDVVFGNDFSDQLEKVLSI